jgi:hypothetical protein
MKAIGKKLAAVVGGVWFLVGAAPSGAQSIAPGQVYDSAFRASLMQQGWKPDAAYGLKIANGAPLYRFPEVLCGPEICRAKWRDRAGNDQSIMIQRAYNDEPYHIAPQQ